MTTAGNGGGINGTIVDGTVKHATHNAARLTVVTLDNTSRHQTGTDGSFMERSYHTAAIAECAGNTDLSILHGTTAHRTGQIAHQGCHVIVGRDVTFCQNDIADRTSVINETKQGLTFQAVIDIQAGDDMTTAVIRTVKTLSAIGADRNPAHHATHVGKVYVSSLTEKDVVIGGIVVHLLGKRFQVGNIGNKIGI